MIIWTYWENRYSAQLPAYLALCFETIRHHAGRAEVRMVTPETLGNYVADLPAGFDKLIPAHKADYLRVRLLHDHGGMWIDLDTVAFAPLDVHFLDRLEDAELVSIGSGDLSQQMFASRAGGSFVAECLDLITAQIETGAPLKWSSIGAEVLWPVSKRHDHHKVMMLAWAHGWRDWQKYLEPGQIDLENRLTCMLYNKMMFPVLRDTSRAEVLDGDTLLGWMLRSALTERVPS